MEAIEVKPAEGDTEAWGVYDGIWSLFNLQIGNQTSQYQNFRFVPSTSSFQTWLPQSRSCEAAPDVASCPSSRGVGIFEDTQSQGYIANRSDSYRFFAATGMTLGAGTQPETLFGADYATAGDTGRDILRLQARNNTWFQASQTTTVVEDGWYNYFLPIFGIGFGEWVFRGQTVPSFMKAISDDGTIPSRSWGYTAGASYFPEGIGTPGSLVFGGYDASRITPDTTATLPLTDGEMLVEVIGITMQFTSEGSQAHNVPFKAFIDSTVPYLYLPDAVCDMFVTRYNLAEDTGRNLFTLNATTANTNQLATTGIQFAIGGSTGGSNGTTIQLPYDALNVLAHWSWGYLAVSEQPIFPIRRQVNTSDYAILGRPFLQEAYIHANYEPEVKQFNISQQRFPEANTPAQIMTVHAAEVPSNHPAKSLGGGAIAGIVIGAVAGVALIAFALWFFLRRRNRKRQEALKVKSEMAEPKNDPFPAYDGMYDPRRGTFSSTAATEVDGGTSSFPSSPRPTHARQLSATASELSAELDNERERGHTMMATVHETHEMGDKMDASTYEALERNVKMARGASPNGPSPMEEPGELPGSHDWINPDRRGSAPENPSPGTVTPQPVSPQPTTPQPDAERLAPLFNDREHPTRHLAPNWARQS